MDKVEINRLPAHVVIRPEIVGYMVHTRPGFLKRIMYRIAYLAEFYIPVALIFTSWIALVYFGAEYLNKH
ncbi:hypothetical protein HV079_18085 [Citrobacter freundii]|uniref:hypothetical protein n=1 Tax=Citrobacter freundii TaxID=546 RepID=UPI0015E8FEFC|nr:hypothetical protein [Citrobacter freundii]QLZ60942.1 hypothetical protein HV079_18085 [Citrobacter freundii]